MDEDYSNLCNSEICRLCAEENPNGSKLYENLNEEIDINKLINRYLPLKVSFLPLKSSTFDFRQTKKKSKLDPFRSLKKNKHFDQVVPFL